MKRRNLFVKIVFHIYLSIILAITHISLIQSSTVTQQTRVWDILSDNVTVISSIESKVCDIDTVLDSLVTITSIDTIHTKYCNVSSSLGDTYSIIDSISDSLATFESTADTIISTLDTIISTLDIIHIDDFGGTWTVIDEIETSICGRFDAINASLDTVEMKIDAISGDQLEAFLGTCTVILSISDVVLQNMELIENIASDAASDIDTIESAIDIIMETSDTIESKIDALTIQITEAFNATFTALEVLDSKAILVDEKIISINDVLSGLTQLPVIEGKLNSIDSKVDLLDGLFQSNCDVLETIDSHLDDIVMQVCTIDSKIDILESVQDLVSSQIQTVTTQTSVIDSALDAVLFTSDTFGSKLCFIESSLENLLESISTIDQLTETSCMVSIEIESKAGTLESIADQSLDNICTLESKVDLGVQSLISIESTLSTFDALESSLDLLNANLEINLNKTCTVASKIDNLASDISIVDSLVDIIQCDIAEPCCMKLVTTAQPVNSSLACDWSVDDKIIAVGLASGGAQDTVNTYLFNNDTLTLADTAQPGSDNSVFSLQWHPHLSLFAVGKDLGGDELYTYAVDENGNLTQVDSTTTSEGHAVAWHPTGDYLVAGGQRTGIEIVLYPVDSLGNIDEPGRISVATTPFNVIRGSMDWDVTGSYLAVGFDRGAVGENLRIYEFNTGPLSLVQNVALQFVDQEVAAVSWHPTTTDFLAVSTNSAVGPCDMCVYRHDASEETLTLLSSVSLPNNGSAAIDWSPDGNCLVAGGSGEVRIHSFDTTTYALTLAQTFTLTPNVAIRDIRWSREGNHLAIATADPGLYVYERASLIAKVTNLEESVSEIDILSQTILSKIDVTENISATIASKVCDIESRIDLITTNLYQTEQSFIITTSNLGLLEDDFEETWTVLEALCSKIEVVDELTLSINDQLSTLDGIEVAADASGTFTALKELEDNICTVESILNMIDLTPPDISGTFSVLDEILAKACTMESRLEEIQLDLLAFDTSNCIGQAITTDLVGTTGYTISESGKYFLVTNTDFAPGVSATAITISANNVELDLCGSTLLQTNATAGVDGINVGSVQNVTIRNGTIKSMTGDNITIDNNASGIVIDNILVTDAGAIGIEFVGTATQVMISNCTASLNGSHGIAFVTGSRIIVQDTVSTQNTGDGINITPSTGSIDQVQIIRCSSTRNTADGVAIDGITSGSQTGIIIDDCLFSINAGDGISATNVKNSVFRNNSILRNTTNGIELLEAVENIDVYDNVISRNLGGRGILVNDSTALPCTFFNNIMPINSTYNYREESSAGSHSVLSNYALRIASSEANNYSAAGGTDPTTINKSIISQSVGTFGTRPGRWRNISMTTPSVPF